MFLNEGVVDLMVACYLDGLRHCAGAGYRADEELGGGWLVLVLREAGGVLPCGLGGIVGVEGGLEVGEGGFIVILQGVFYVWLGDCGLSVGVRRCA